MDIASHFQKHRIYHDLIQWIGSVIGYIHKGVQPL